jgi:wyosine [tRNA(Phe)-imidazoG37] synthetase (radical SAM superfamily)
LDHHRPGEIDWITFVGSGEPLLHAGMGWMIERVKRLTSLPVAVITNGALLSNPKVRDEICPANAVLPSLDAGTQELYKRINRPHPGVSLDDHIAGLSAFRSEFSGNLWVETMLVRGLNDGDEAMEDIASALQRIDPDEVHINVPARVPAEEWVKEPEEAAITRAMAMLGGIARVILPAHGCFDLSGFDNIVEAVASVVSRHPMREEELKRALESRQDVDVDMALIELEASNEIHVVERDGTRYWCSSQAYYPRDKENTWQ